MARIRTVKPEFWTSTQIVECSMIARLLFIGMWNFCDDGGIHVADCRRLKMEIFPGDDILAIDVQKLVDELVLAKLLYEYEVGGQKYWQVTGWSHQKIDKPSFKHPKRPALYEESTEHGRKVGDQSTNDLLPLGERQPPEGSLKESKGWDVDKKIAAPFGGSDHKIDPTGFCEAVIDRYQAHWQTKPPCDFPTIQKILTHIERHPVAANLGWWGWYFEFARTDEFLIGQKRPGFVASLSYLLKPETLALIIEAGQRAALAEVSNG